MKYDDHLGAFLCWLFGHAPGAGFCPRCRATAYTDDRFHPHLASRLLRLIRTLRSRRKPF